MAIEQKVELRCETCGGTELYQLCWQVENGLEKLDRVSTHKIELTHGAWCENCQYIRAPETPNFGDD